MLQKQAGAVRTGGKGTQRRKKKVVRKNQVADDKRLQQTIKRLGGTTLKEVDEVQMFKDDGTVLVFKQAKLQAAPQSNACAASPSLSSSPSSSLGAALGVASFGACSPPPRPHRTPSPPFAPPFACFDSISRDLFPLSPS